MPRTQGLGGEGKRALFWSLLVLLGFASSLLSHKQCVHPKGPSVSQNTGASATLHVNCTVAHSGQQLPALLVFLSSCLEAPAVVFESFEEAGKKPHDKPCSSPVFHSHKTCIETEILAYQHLGGASCCLLGG